MQLKTRLEYLLDHYGLFDCSPTDDDELCLKISNAPLSPVMIGEVYSSACVKKFALLQYDQLLLAEKKYKFIVECREIAGTHISYRQLPELEALITLADEDELPDRHAIACKVTSNRSNGRYTVTIEPGLYQLGEQRVHIYQPRPYPCKQYYVQNCPLEVYVDM